MEWASGVELASCQFPAYFRAGRMPSLLLLIPRLTQRLIFIYNFSKLFGKFNLPKDLGLKPRPS
ncbi:hypothetical protein, partial [Moorena sp. SIO3B2]|uniref:hypothetical protein n=1 Tax=Moorena sp. SIO3B2 TaxID=2607827 RepID=UPI00257A1FE1